MPLDATIQREPPSSPALLAAVSGRSTELGQVLAVLAVIGVERPHDLTLAVGDRMLLDLQERLSGRPLRIVVTCPTCGTVNSAVIESSVIGKAAPRSAWLGPGGGLREPTYADLVALPIVDQEAAEQLLRSCTVGVPPRMPTEDDFELVDNSLTGPLRISCIECGRGIEAAVDLQRMALDGLQKHLASTDYEVHLLARAYQWDLEKIEKLPDERRRRFAQFVTAGQ
jgi:hypothetical protein